MSARRLSRAAAGTSPTSMTDFARLVGDPAGTRSVPLRALVLSLMALAAAALASMLWPDVVLRQQLVASVLALIPAFLLAHYRGWASVSTLLGLGMIALMTMHFLIAFL